MPINRGPWNSLVDDDGSNLVGSVWNKAAIKTVVLDPSEAAIDTPWIDVALNAGDFSWSVPSFTTFAYRVNGKTMTLAFYAASTVVSGTPSSLTIKIPGGYLGGRSMGAPYNYFSGVAGAGWALTQGGAPAGVITLYRDILGTAWAAGTLHISMILTFNIA